MTLTERDIAHRLAREAASIPLPPRDTWTRGPSRNNRRALQRFAIIVSTLVVLTAAAGLGQLITSMRVPAASLANRELEPLPTDVTQAQAITAVRTHEELLGRIDRTDAKLMTLGEYLALAGPIHTMPADPMETPDPNAVTGFSGDPSRRYIWVVALSGEVWPNHRMPVSFGHSSAASPTPNPPYRWAVFLVDASTGTLAAVADAGVSEIWPTRFSRLPNHPVGRRDGGGSP